MSRLSLCLVPFQYPLYTLMVFDKWRNGVPVAFILTSRSTQLDLSPWMAALNSKLVLKMPEWHPNAFIVDDAQAEINALRCTHFTPHFLFLIFQCSLVPSSVPYFPFRVSARYLPFYVDRLLLCSLRDTVGFGHKSMSSCISGTFDTRGRRTLAARY
jgi:hypothetical protein